MAEAELGGKRLCWHCVQESPSALEPLCMFPGCRRKGDFGLQIFSSFGRDTAMKQWPINSDIPSKLKASLGSSCNLEQVRVQIGCTACGCQRSLSWLVQPLLITTETSLNETQEILSHLRVLWSQLTDSNTMWDCSFVSQRDSHVMKLISLS